MSLQFTEGQKTEFSLSETRRHGLQPRDSDTEPSPAPPDPRRSAAAGLHGPPQPGLPAEHAAGEPAAAEGNVAEKHHHRSDSQHPRPGTRHGGPAPVTQVRLSRVKGGSDVVNPG